MDKKKYILIFIGLLTMLFGFYLLINKNHSFFNKTDVSYKSEKSLNKFIVFSKIFKTEKNIHIDGIEGDILINGSDDKKNHISIQSIVYEKDKNKAEAIKNKIKISFKRLDGKTVISAQLGAIGYKKLKLIVNIRLGDSIKLYLNNSNGIINASNIKSNLNITNINGNIQLDNISGDVFIKRATNTVIKVNNVSKIMGNFFNSKTNISKSKGIINIYTVGGKLKINSNIYSSRIKIISKNCRVFLSDINSKTISVKLSYDDIFLKNISSEIINVDMQNGNFIINGLHNISSLIIDANYSNIRLNYNKIIKPKYILNLFYGKISGHIDNLHINNINNILNAETNMGKPEIIIKGKYSKLLLKTLN